MERFLLHMLVASFLAPGFGCVVYIFKEFPFRWNFSETIANLLLSIIVGFPFWIFIWFWAIPLGLLTYFLCMLLRKTGSRSKISWGIGAAAIGYLFGLFIKFWIDDTTDILPWSGVWIGMATGMVLHAIWFTKWNFYQTD